MGAPPTVPHSFGERRSPCAHRRSLPSRGTTSTFRARVHFQPSSPGGPFLTRPLHGALGKSEGRPYILAVVRVLIISRVEIACRRQSPHRRSPHRRSHRSPRPRTRDTRATLRNFGGTPGTLNASDHTGDSPFPSTCVERGKETARTRAYFLRMQQTVCVLGRRHELHRVRQLKSKHPPSLPW